MDTIKIDKKPQTVTEYYNGTYHHNQIRYQFLLRKYISEYEGIEYEIDCWIGKEPEYTGEAEYQIIEQFKVEHP